MSIANNKSLIFIPDISGFTRFISGTEIDHSRHIISELLEVVIDANDTGLTVAEIEGDAILFYQENSQLSIKDMLVQVEKMFLRFHEHLRLYQSRRICDCGACTTAIGLTIKFIVHFAEFGIIEVKQFRKPYGYEVIRAHRLLKNNLDEKEYILITDDSLSKPERRLEFPGNQNWFKPKKGVIQYDNFGETEFHFSLLKNLHTQVTDPPPIPVFERSDNPIIKEIFIEKPIEEVYDALSNFEKRLKWQNGVKDILYDANKVNRVGTQHVCLIGSNRIEFETVKTGDDKSKRTFTERTSNVPFKIVKETLTHFEFSENGNGTDVRIEVHYLPQPFPRAFLANIFRKEFEKTLPGFLNDLKVFCEKQ